MTDVLISNNDTNTNTSHPPPSVCNNAAANNKILQKRWVCDVCKVKWFLDFKEACDHEASCTGVGVGESSTSISSSTSSPESSLPSASAALVVVGEHSIESVDSNDANGSSSSSTARRKRGGAVSKSSNCGGNPTANEVANAIAAARARVAQQSNPGNKPPNNSGSNVAKKQRKNNSPIVLELSDTDSSSSNSSGGNVVSPVPKRGTAAAAAAAGGGGGKQRTTEILDESTSTSSSSSSGDRRKSKRLRDPKPPPLKDNNTSTSTSNREELDGKKEKKKAKKIKSSSSSAKSDDKHKPSSSKTSKSKAGSTKSSNVQKKGANKKGSFGGGTLASIFLSKKKSTTSTSSATASSSSQNRTTTFTQKASSSVEDVHVPPGVSNADYKEHLAAEKQQAAKKNKKRRAADDQEDGGNTKKVTKKQHTTAKRTAIKRGARKKQVVDIESSSSSESESSEEDDVEYVERPSKSRGKARASTSAAAAAATKKNARETNFLTKLTSSKKVMGEHQAADFFAKRKQKAAEERERQRKRDEMRAARLNEKAAGESGSSNLFPSSGKGGVVDSSEEQGMSRSSSTVDLGGEQQGKKKSGGNKSIPAVRFPCPSHVVPTESGDDLELMETDTATLDALRKTPRYPHLPPDMSPSDDSEEEMVALSANLFQGTDQVTCLEKNSTFDLLSTVFDVGSDQKKRSSKSSNSNNINEEEEDKQQLLVDKYAMSQIPEDVLGSDNKEASKKLLNFIEEWKVRRHKSVQSMGQVKKKKRSRRKKHGYDSDDSFLDDGEHGGLENLFLITGPTGSGKTRLVHAVAEQSECVVIEINSSAVRSGSALKKAIQETTQSHSNLAMSKKKKTGGGGGGNALFGKKTAVEESDDESGRFFDESSDEEESVRESHSLTVILIDEVDLLFEDDTAFWPALAQVSQKAKCPIILTAASTPFELYKNFHFQEIRLERPPPLECGLKMTEVSRLEGIPFKEDIDLEEKSKRLSLIAESCKCDMRLLLNEMQMFQFAKSSKHTSERVSTDMDDFGLHPKVECSELASSTVDDRPEILGVEPRLLRKDIHTLITITGRHFSTTVFPSQCDKVEPVQLLIAGEECRHFRVISEEKILAICPPCVFPKDVSDETAIYEDTKNVDCLTSIFAPVVVRKRCSNGLVLDSISRIGLESNDPGGISNIEYDIPIRETVFDQKMSRDDFIRKAKAQKEARERMANESEGFMSSEEDEFEKESDRLVHNDNEEKHEPENDQTMDEPCEEKEEIKILNPQDILDEAVAGLDLCDTHAVLPTEDSPVKSENINCFADELACLSDAVLLEDSFTVLAIPLLSGAVEGFGSHAFDSSSGADQSIDRLCKGKNKKPPSFETLYATGANESGFFFGNSDAYTTHPVGQRDRRLLSYSELHSRGLGYLDNFTLPSDENSDDSKSAMETEETDPSFVQLRASIQSEDEILLGSQVSPSLLSLPSVLAQGLRTAPKHGFTRNLSPLLQMRLSGISLNALGIMHLAVANGNVWYHGLRHDDEDEAMQKIQVWRRDPILDQPLSLDYLPYLRGIARHENKVRSQVNELMAENEGRPRRGKARRTRTSASALRRHYLDECSDGKDRAILLQKCAELSENYMG